MPVAIPVIFCSATPALIKLSGNEFLKSFNMEALVFRGVREAFFEFFPRLTRHKFDINFNQSRVQRLLSNINSNKAQGPDGIHGKILKKCAQGLACPLSYVYKISYNSGYIPNEWKLANVVPVFKKGNKSKVENYRPISLTCLVMKVFERIVV